MKNSVDLLVLLSFTLWIPESHSWAGDSSVWEGASVPRLAAGQQSVQLHHARRQVSTATHLDRHLTSANTQGPVWSHTSPNIQMLEFSPIKSLFCLFFQSSVLKFGKMCCQLSTLTSNYHNSRMSFTSCTTNVTRDPNSGGFSIRRLRLKLSRNENSLYSWLYVSCCCNPCVRTWILWAEMWTRKCEIPPGCCLVLFLFRALKPHNAHFVLHSTQKECKTKMFCQVTMPRYSSMKNVYIEIYFLETVESTDSSLFCAGDNG